MLKNVIIPEGVNVAEWAMVDENDYKAREWIWHRLIGETRLGDTVEFCVLHRSADELFCGIVRDRAGELKTLVPAIVTKERDGLYTAIYHNGMKMEGRVDEIESGDEISQIPVDMDALGREWLNDRLPL